MQVWFGDLIFGTFCLRGHSFNADSEKDKDLALTCEKCEFVAKSEGGLKTHKTEKHNKTVSLRAYTKVTR